HASLKPKWHQGNRRLSPSACNIDIILPTRGNRTASLAHLFQFSRFASSPEASLNRITFRPLFLSTIYGEVCASAFEFFQLGCFAYGWIFRHTLVEETRLQGRGVCLR